MADLLLFRLVKGNASAGLYTINMVFKPLDNFNRKEFS